MFIFLQKVKNLCNVQQEKLVQMVFIFLCFVTFANVIFCKKMIQ